MSMRTPFRTVTSLAVVCGLVSLAASLPAAAKPTDGTEVLSERVAMLVRAAPAEGSSDAKKTQPESKKKKKKKGKKTGKRKKSSKQKSGAKAEGSRKTVLEEDFLVEGKLEKPNAYYILRRSQAGYDWARLDAKFLPLVLESVQDPLF